MINQGSGGQASVGPSFRSMLLAHGGIFRPELNTEQEWRTWVCLEMGYTMVYPRKKNDRKNDDHPIDLGY